MAPPRKTRNGKDIGTRVDGARVKQAERHLKACSKRGLHDPPCEGLSDVWRHCIDAGAPTAAKAS